MAASYEFVRAAAWTPATADDSIVARYRALRFPETWQPAILDLCNASRSADAERWQRAPTMRMELAVQALAPDLLALPRASTEGGPPGFWLCAPEEAEPLPETAFARLRNAWLKDLRPELSNDSEYRALLKDVRETMDGDPPKWETAEFELLRCPQTGGSTAAPLTHQYALTTDWLARRILTLPPYEFEGGCLRFHAMPRGPRDRGAELVSEPLDFHDAKGRVWWYSIVLHITLHTVPFHPLPRVHLHCGIRRWATRTGTTGRLYLPHGRNTTVLLRPKVPWLPGAPLSDRFAVAKLERRRDPESGQYAADWAGGGPAALLCGISLQSPFPSAEEVLTSPEAWITPDLHAAVLHSTAMGAHGVRSGLMSDQRSKIVSWAEQAFPAELRPVPERRRTALGPAAPANAPVNPPKSEKAAHAERRARAMRTSTAFALGALGPVQGTPTLEARLLWQTPEMRDTLISALIGHLGLKDDGIRPSEAEYEACEPGAAAVLEWRAAELTVRLRCCKLTDGLGGDLPIPDGARRTRGVVAEAIATRRDGISAFVSRDGLGTAPSLALVELDRAADFSSPDHDPKFALRLGLAKAGVLSQFVSVPKKAKGHNSVGNADHRALKAWDDGLRQLGARGNPEHGVTEGIPDGMRFASIWLVRKNRTARNRWAADAPVAVLITPERPGSELALIEGFDPEGDDGAGEWVPYPVMLLRLAARTKVTDAAGTDDSEAEPRRTTRRQSDEQQRKATERWLQKVQKRLRGTPTLLFAHAQNARRHWTWLQDGKVEMDRIRTGLAPSRPMDPDLRLLRVRNGDGREVPQWWGVHPKGGANGIPAHLWVPGEDDPNSRIFWSTTAKPAQFRQSAVQADKLAPRALTLGKRAGELTIDTDKPGWNPALLELAVLGCHEDDGDVPEALALVAHHLRQPPEYPEALALPLPLHLAALAQEYVLPTDPDRSDSE